MAQAEAVEMPNCCVVLLSVVWPTEGFRRPGASSPAWTEVPPSLWSCYFQVKLHCGSSRPYYQQLNQKASPKHP